MMNGVWSTQGAVAAKIVLITSRPACCCIKVCITKRIFGHWKFTCCTTESCFEVFCFFFQSKGVWGYGNLSFHDRLQSCQFFLESKRLTWGHVKASLVSKASKSARPVFVSSTKTWLNTYFFLPHSNFIWSFMQSTHAPLPWDLLVDINHMVNGFGVSLSTWIPCFSRVVLYPFFFFVPHQKSFNSHRSRSHTNFR